MEAAAKKGNSGNYRKGHQVTTRIYVNRDALHDNAHNLAASRRVVRVDRDGVPEDCYGVEIHGPSRVVYSVRRTFDGAHVWIETEAEVTPIDPIRTEP